MFGVLSRKAITAAIVLTLLTELVYHVYASPVEEDGLRFATPYPVTDRIVYDRDLLFELASTPASKGKPDYDIPTELRKRKRGKRGGVRLRLRRRKFRPPLPSIITGNCQSLCNKLDELKACVRFRHEYRESCMMCFSETWFSSKNTDNYTSMA